MLDLVFLGKDSEPKKNPKSLFIDEEPGDVTLDEFVERGGQEAQ